MPFGVWALWSCTHYLDAMEVSMFHYFIRNPKPQPVTRLRRDQVAEALRQGHKVEVQYKYSTVELKWLPTY